jgi:hypothetical protein
MKRLKPFWLTRIAVLALTISFVAACSDDSTGPNGDIDPEQAAEALDGVVAQFFEGNEALSSFAVSSDLIAGALAGSDVVLFDFLPRAGTVEGLTRSVQASIADARSMQKSGVPARIPVGMLGNTFVYNPGTDRYEIDQARTDAPANAVRFILYAVDPILQQIVLDAQDQPTEIGYIDISDTSDFPTVNVGLVAVVNDVTLIDVEVTGTFSQTTLDLGFSGTLSDGSQDLTFRFDLSGSETGFAADFTLTAGGYTVNFVFSGSDTGGSVTATITGEGTIVFTMSVDALDNIDGSITINGSQVAIMSGTTDAPIVTNGDGGELTEEEMLALANLFEGMGEIFEIFFGLADFALVLLVLGTI